MRISTKIKTFLLCAALTTLPGNVSQRRMHIPQEIADAAALDSLLNNLPMAQANRIRTLLDRGYKDCQGSFLTYVPPNCHGTMFWVIDEDLNPTYDSYKVIPKLKSMGFVQVAEIDAIKPKYPFRKLANLDEYGLLPGDVILFSGKSLPETINTIPTIVHSARYLGSFNGRHYFFHKPDNDCGDRSPFEIRDLETYLKERIQDSLKYDINITLHIYRGI